eukprot:5602408-Prymnesium_polylepis.2
MSVSAFGGCSFALGVQHVRSVPFNRSSVSPPRTINVVAPVKIMRLNDERQPRQTQTTLPSTALQNRRAHPPQEGLTGARTGESPRRS